jgi:hypothetical protein
MSKVTIYTCEVCGGCEQTAGSFPNCWAVIKFTASGRTFTFDACDNCGGYWAGKLNDKPKLITYMKKLVGWKAPAAKGAQDE